MRQNRTGRYANNEVHPFHVHRAAKNSISSQTQASSPYFHRGGRVLRPVPSVTERDNQGQEKNSTRQARSSSWLRKRDGSGAQPQRQAQMKQRLILPGSGMG